VLLPHFYAASLNQRLSVGALALPRPASTAKAGCNEKTTHETHNHCRLPVCCSRLGGRRIVFQPYTQQQLVQIVQTRLDGLDVFEPSAIRFAAAKVAASPLCSAVQTAA